MNKIPTLLRFASCQIKYPVINNIRLISTTSPLFTKVVIPLPALGDSVSDGTIVSWNKKIGDNVKADEILAVIETDKVSVDITSPQAGFLAETYGAEGATITVGKPLCALETDEVAAKNISKEVKPTSTPAEPAKPVATPSQPPQSTQSSQGIKPQPYVPMIKFRYGKGREQTNTPKVVGKPGENVIRIDFLDTPPMYGHIVYSEKVIEAINSGCYNI